MKKTGEKCSNRRDGSVWLVKPRPHTQTGNQVSKEKAFLKVNQYFRVYSSTLKVS